MTNWEAGVPLNGDELQRIILGVGVGNRFFDWRFRVGRWCVDAHTPPMDSGFGRTRLWPCESHIR